MNPVKREKQTHNYNTMRKCWKGRLLCVEVGYLTQIAGDGSKEKNIYGEDNVYTEFVQACVRFVYNSTFQT